MNESDEYEESLQMGMRLTLADRLLEFVSLMMRSSTTAWQQCDDGVVHCNAFDFARQFSKRHMRHLVSHLHNTMHWCVTHHLRRCVKIQPQLLEIYVVPPSANLSIDKEGGGGGALLMNVMGKHQGTLYDNDDETKQIPYHPDQNTILVRVNVEQFKDDDKSGQMKKRRRIEHSPQLQKVALKERAASDGMPNTFMSARKRKRRSVL